MTDPSDCTRFSAAAMAGAQERESAVTPPPPVIGRAGSYTVFITSTTTPKPTEAPRPQITSPSQIHANVAPLVAPKAPPSPPPVQVPPQQFEKPNSRRSAFGFFWDAIAKVQDAHLSLDEYLADWFGLDQSKYQWALNDYYESSDMEKDGKQKGLGSKGQQLA